MIEINYTLFTILMTAACIGLAIAIWSMKSKKKEVDEKLQGKKITSNENYLTQVIIFTIISIVTGISCFNFGYNRMGWEGGAIAACISLVLFSAYLRNNRKHNKTNSAVEWILILFFLSFEILVIGANFVTQAEANPNQRIEEKRQSIRDELVRLKSKHITNPKNNTDKYDNRLNSEKISLEKIKLEALPVYQNNEKKFFESSAALLGFPVNSIELLFNISIAGLLAVGCAMTGSRINSYTCPYLIKKQVKIEAEIKAIIQGPTQSTTATASVKQSVEVVSAGGSSQFDDGISRGIRYIEDNHELQTQVGSGELKKKMGLKRADEMPAVDRLVKLGYLKRKNNGGTSPRYLRAQPKSIEKPAEIAAEPAKKARVFNIFGSKSN